MMGVFLLKAHFFCFFFNFFFFLIGIYNIYKYVGVGAVLCCAVWCRVAGVAISSVGAVLCWCCLCGVVLLVFLITIITM